MIFRFRGRKQALIFAAGQYVRARRRRRAVDLEISKVRQCAVLEATNIRIADTVAFDTPPQPTAGGK